MIAIIDYGMGNLRSVQKAVEFLGYSAVITSDFDTIKNAEGIILPGVGAFPDAMDNLNEKGLVNVIKKAVQNNTPLLGICLGMQLLFDESEEFRLCNGLGLIKGRIEKIYAKVKIPHMGWNNLEIIGDTPILEGVEDGSYVYFVHSYYANVADDSLVAKTQYGMDITAVVSKGNVFGMQFHPEKSGEVGMKMLKNFCQLAENTFKEGN